MGDRVPFPRDQSEFADDPRIAFSKEKNNYLLEDEKGTEWEWIPSRSTWSETVSCAKCNRTFFSKVVADLLAAMQVPEELMQQWSEAYKVPGVDENEPAMNPAQKRKQAQLEDV
jgi:HIV Tat-specific factor 1